MQFQFFGFKIFPKYIKNNLPLSNITFISKTTKRIFISSMLFHLFLRLNSTVIFILNTISGLCFNFSFFFKNNNNNFICLLAQVF